LSCALSTWQHSSSHVTSVLVLVAMYVHGGHVTEVVLAMPQLRTGAIA
jgi:hypothetical protein